MAEEAPRFSPASPLSTEVAVSAVEKSPHSSIPWCYNRGQTRYLAAEDRMKLTPWDSSQRIPTIAVQRRLSFEV